MKHRILVTFGTRPEAIKMAPVVQDLRSRAGLEVRVVTTGQHRGLLDQVTELFGVKVDADLAVMSPNQSLSHITSEVLKGIEREIISFQPQLVVVHGDTTTTFAASLASYYQRVKLAHVEAGLRTGDRFNPFPEEMNRKVTDDLADFLFAPTERAKQQLLKEGSAENRIWVTGNTVIDTLLHIRQSRSQARLPRELEGLGPYVLLTCHRRETFGEEQTRVFKAIRELAQEFRDVQWVFPMHPNPNLRNGVQPILKDLLNVRLIEPVDYSTFVQLMSGCLFIVTDSGGVQEEAPTFGKPVLVLRKFSERMESVDAGFSKLIATDPKLLTESARHWLEDRSRLQVFEKMKNPYGDGKAARRIGDVIESSL